MSGSGHTQGTLVTIRHRTAERVGRWLALVAIVVLGLASWLHPSVAAAASDQFDSWTANYRVATDGSVQVDETLVYRFDSGSARHGITRTLLLREPWGNADQDAVYDYTDIAVSSPDAPAQTQISRDSSGRERFLQIRIGDPNVQVRNATATYHISYRITGAMRTSGSYDEFYWDVVGDNTPTVNNISLSVTVPGGVQDVACYAGQAGTNHPCTTAVLQNATGDYAQTSKSPSEIVTIGAKISPGLITDNAPHLVPADAGVSVAGVNSHNAVPVAGLVAGLSAVVSGVVVWLFVRSRRDERFAGLPPGTLPAAGENVPIVPATRHETIPVRFEPPDIPVATGGLLVDGRVDATETAATLVQLATQGALEMRTDQASGWLSTSKSTVYVRLVNPAVARAPHEVALLDALFPNPGKEVALRANGDLTQVSDQLARNVADEARQQGWLRHPFVANALRTSSGYAVVALIFLSVAFFVALGLSHSPGSSAFLVLPILGVFLPPLVAVLVANRLTRRGTRNAVGRALTDQVEGFRTYLSTAEADQIRFEEGEDIFSRYLPWAIVFGIAERWARLCTQLVEMGRLSAQPPAWYYGDRSAFSYLWFTNATMHTMQQAAMPVMTSSSGSGWGGGSSFGSGGGFSGGGGGGGGAGGW